MSEGRDRFLNAAVAIGRRLCRDAVWRDGRCNWLGWAMEPHGGEWVSAYRAMGVSSTTAPAGVGLFLAHIARGDRRSDRRRDRRGRARAGAFRRRGAEQAGEYGFYSGLAGVAQVCMAGGDALG